jgi:hypothetical protein
MMPDERGRKRTVISLMESRLGGRLLTSDQKQGLLRVAEYELRQLAGMVNIASSPSAANTLIVTAVAKSDQEQREDRQRRDDQILGPSEEGIDMDT